MVFNSPPVRVTLERKGTEMYDDDRYDAQQNKMINKCKRVVPI